MTMSEQVNAYKADLDLFEDNNAKMEYILDFGHEAPTIDPSYKSDDNIIKGCSSLAWLHKSFDGDNIRLEAEGDSIIAKGMLVMLLGIFDDRTPEEILAFDPNELKSMGLLELLSPVRQQGLEAFLNVIYGYAAACKENQA
ncbi:MAG: SufE family protein [Helicobacteraceae bacterium]|jgi:cysteine desulfuration protein SufE|nr:SufE family protein [Helicobacteraceae bacterium]